MAAWEVREELPARPQQRVKSSWPLSGWVEHPSLSLLTLDPSSKDFETSQDADHVLRGASG